MKKMIVAGALLLLVCGSYTYVSSVPSTIFSNNEMEDEDTLSVTTSENQVMVSPEDYLYYVGDSKNGLVKTKQMENFEFRLQYIPAEMQSLRELKDEHITNARFNEKLKELDSLQYYTFTISNQLFRNELVQYNIKSEEDYNERINYFSFRMQKDIHLIQGKDTLSCALFHFERTYSIVPDLTFCVAFKKMHGTYSKRFCYNDSVFNNGSVQIMISKNDLVNIPKIKID